MKLSEYLFSMSELRGPIKLRCFRKMPQVHNVIKKENGACVFL